MKPVTELYEAANQVLKDGSADALAEAIYGLEDDRNNANRELLEVLDLVATSNRLDLVRWVLEDGLGWGSPWPMVDVLARLVEAGAHLMGAHGCDRHGHEEIAAAVQAGRQYVARMRAALSGGEGGAKCPECQGQGYHEVEHVSETERVLDTEKCETCDGTGEGRKTCSECHDTGKVKRVEGGGSVRVVKYDPCPKCTAGAAQAMEEAAKDEDTKPREPGCQCHIEEGDSPCRVHGEEEHSTKPEAEIRDLETRLAEVRGKIRSYDGGDRPSSPPVVLLREEDDLRTRIYMLRAAQYAAKPKPTILPAGKPPPFLRVGMVLMHPEAHRALTLVVLDEPVAYVRGMGLVGWVQTKVLLTLPLAEPFTVEGES